MNKPFHPSSPLALIIISASRSHQFLIVNVKVKVVSLFLLFILRCKKASLSVRTACVCVPAVCAFSSSSLDVRINETVWMWPPLGAAEELHPGGQFFFFYFSQGGAAIGGQPLIYWSRESADQDEVHFHFKRPCQLHLEWGRRKLRSRETRREWADDESAADCWAAIITATGTPGEQRRENRYAWKSICVIPNLRDTWRNI